MKRRWAWALCVSAIFCAGCGAAPAPLPAAESAPPQLHYAITMADDLSSAQVTLCSDLPLDALRALNQHAADHFSEPVAFQDRCVRYQARWGGLSRQVLRLSSPEARTLAATQAAFLLRPLHLPAGLQVVVDFTLPEGVHLHAPPSQTGGAPGASRLVGDRNYFLMLGDLILSDAPLWSFDAGHVRVQLVSLGALNITREETEAWVRSLLATYEESLGPLPHCELLLALFADAGFPNQRSERDGVAFGMVRRGLGASIRLFFRQGATLEAIERDWEPIHELSHLALPKLGEEDRWLSEGFATYAQELLRVRAGLIEEEALWRSFIGGFERAARSRSRGTLSGLSGDFARIYWAGTFAMLELDLALHRGGSSLFALLAAREHVPARAEGLGYLESLLEGSPQREAIMAQLRARARSTRFEAPTALLRSLGVLAEGGEIRFDEHAEFAALRRALMAP